ncbi:hypothetical protein CMI44_01680 [Candidatus Pacearchaeota archaeon]|nr:hypothetical protein [Candidatus Pacearchaeota archaeon]|tara:strand:+ start:275 stop:817 length:543 start_codon:yes stop_codon:yes gene_type:complete
MGLQTKENKSKISTRVEEMPEETKNIRAVLIIDVVGKPPEHLIETLEKIIDQLKEEKGVQVKGKKIKEPMLVKDSQQFYTTFAEIEVEVEEILYLAILMFKYMPAHIEIVYPELIALTNNGWNDILNELTRRLHGYDEIAKVLQVQNKQLKEKLQEILEEKKKKKPEKKNVVKKKIRGKK